MWQNNGKNRVRSHVRGLLAVAVACTTFTTVVRADDAPAGATTQPTAGQNAGGSLIAQGLDPNGTDITLTVSQTRVVVTSVPMKTVDLPQDNIVQLKMASPTIIVLTGKKPGNAQLLLIDDAGNSQKIPITVNPDLAGLQDELHHVLPGMKIQTSAANGAIVLTGHVPDAKMADQVVQIATPYATKVINLLEISGGQQVTLQVRFAEVSKSAIEALGVNFGISNGSKGFGANVIGQVEPFGIAQAQKVPDTLLLGVPNPGSNVTNFGQFTAGHTPFDVFLTALKQNNLLRVLAEPNLTCISGEKASFLAGGEFPYPVPQSNGGTTGGTTITLEFKTYGVKLNFLPVVLGDGRIRLSVTPEVSALDYTNALQLNGFTIPGITTRTANTTVELNEGQTLAMAGLMNTRVNATNTATPLLGELPVIGALFRSVRYERDETELVVLVTPRMSAGMNPESVPALPGESWRYPGEGELFVKGDLGGPKADASHRPSALPPRQFRGTYGFTPVNPPAGDMTK